MATMVGRATPGDVTDRFANVFHGSSAMHFLSIQLTVLLGTFSLANGSILIAKARGRSSRALSR